MWVKRPYKGEFEITSPYGERVHPVTGVKKFHKGIDVAMPEGTELYLPCDCEVTEHINQGGLETGFGRYIIARHKTGQGTIIRFIFAHLSEVLETGKLTQGTLVAKSGNTGTSTGAHLHLQLEAWLLNGWQTLDPTSSIDFREGIV